MDNRIITSEWFSFAERDLDSAIFLLDMDPIPLEIICYHCQQSAEKYLKGYLAYHNLPLMKTHDLVKLCNQCQEIDSSFFEIEDSCIELIGYGIQVRYPFEIEIDSDSIRTALEAATEIKHFITSRIKI